MEVDRQPIIELSMKQVQQTRLNTYCIQCQFSLKASTLFYTSILMTPHIENNLIKKIHVHESRMK